MDISLKGHLLKWTSGVDREILAGGFGVEARGSGGGDPRNYNL